jgi:hypothetical protein
MSEILPAIFFGHGNPMNTLMKIMIPRPGARYGGVSVTQGKFVDFGALVWSRNRGDNLHRTADHSRF